MNCCECGGKILNLQTEVVCNNCGLIYDEYRISTLQPRNYNLQVKMVGGFNKYEHKMQKYIIIKQKLFTFSSNLYYSLMKSYFCKTDLDTAFEILNEIKKRKERTHGVMFLGILYHLKDSRVPKTTRMEFIKKAYPNKSIYILLWRAKKFMQEIGYLPSPPKKKHKQKRVKTQSRSKKRSHKK